MNLDDFVNFIGNRLNNILLHKNMSANELAHISGISRAQIYRILSGSSYTTMETLFNILISLKIPIENFFNFSIPIEEVFGQINISNSSHMLEILSSNLRIQQANLFRLKGLTQQEIAYKLGHSDYRYINYILNGKNNKPINMKVSTLFNICKELELENKIYLLFKTN